MAAGDIKLTFTIVIPGDMKLANATTGVVVPGPTTGSVR